MKKIFLNILLLALVLHSLAQDSICKLKVVVSGQQLPLTAELRHFRSPYNVNAVIKGYEIGLIDTVKKPSLATLHIKFKGDEEDDWYYAFYLEPGEITVKLNRADNSKGALHVDGPQLSMDYTNVLQEPVRIYDRQVDSLYKQLKKPGTDTTSIKQQLNIAIHTCFDVPRTYVRQNPSSDLDIIALSMMGVGDPTIPNPADELMELFHTLPIATQNSEEGKIYWARLQKLIGTQK